MFREDYVSVLENITIKYNILNGQPVLEVSNVRLKGNNVNDKVISLAPITDHKWGCCSFVNFQDIYISINAVLDVVEVKIDTSAMIPVLATFPVLANYGRFVGYQPNVQGVYFAGDVTVQFTGY